MESDNDAEKSSMAGLDVNSEIIITHIYTTQLPTVVSSDQCIPEYTVLKTTVARPGPVNMSNTEVCVK